VLGVPDLLNTLDLPGRLLVPGKRVGMSLPGMPASRRPSRATVSVKVDAEVAARFRELCAAYSGTPHWLRQNMVLERLLRQFIADFEQKLAEGEPSPRTSPSRNSTTHR
jgi:hypothetical protein